MSSNVSHLLSESARNAFENLLFSTDQDAFGEVVFEATGPLTIQGQASAGRLLITHGAGAGLDSSVLSAYRRALAKEGVQTLGVEFAYLREMRRKGRRRPPPKVEYLVDELAQVCDILSRVSPLSSWWLGGKSMGGRVASMLAARDAAAGLILCGYPFHPKGKPEKLRLDHWGQFSCPALVLQGTRDPFGNHAEVSGYTLPDSVEVEWLEDGDHDWKPRRSSGLSQQDLICTAARETSAFMTRHS